MHRIFASLVLAASACVPSHGPSMTPFEDCLGCHSAGGHAKAWTVAGTWRKGAHVSVTDANGKTVAMRGNDVGNFYTREPLAFPVTVSVDGMVMPDILDRTSPARLKYGGCNACHRAEEITTTFDASMLPGHDCLACHAPNGMASLAFSAAGTFPPPQWPAGTRVTVDGQSTTTNAVGNFYVTAPIDFSTPQAAVVGGASMEGGTMYGGCNRCHANGAAEGG